MTLARLEAAENVAANSTYSSIPIQADVDDSDSTADILECLKRQASALERLVALKAVGVQRNLELQAELGANAEELERPPSAIDHDWERQLQRQPMTIECNVIILGLEGVDTANHSFSANVVAEFRVWYPRIPGCDVRDFDPKIRCMNVKELSTDPMTSQYECIKDGSYVFKRQWHGTFVEHLELKHFPMDIQDLSFEFVSDWPADRVKLIKSRTYESRVGGGLGVEVTRDVWAPTTIWDTESVPLRSGRRSEKLAILVREDVTEGAGMHSEALHPTIRFAMQVRRHSTNYLYNIMIPTATLTSLAFCSFTVPLNEVADRASITLTLLLSIIAYKLIIKDELPKVNFLTLIDRYILTSMAIVILIAFANSAVGHAVEEVTSEIQWQDYECRLVLGILWTVCNLAFLAMIARRRRAANRRLRAFKKECNNGNEKSTDVLLLV